MTRKVQFPGQKESITGVQGERNMIKSVKCLVREGIDSGRGGGVNRGWDRREGPRRVEGRVEAEGVDEEG